MISTTHVDPHLFIIFGEPKNLVQRKLLPAVYQLFAQREHKRKMMIIIVARDRELEDIGYRVRHGRLEA